MARTSKTDRRIKQAEALWLGCFEIDEPGAPAKLGSFQMIVMAVSVDDALERCKQRLRALRGTTSLFQRPCRVDLLHILRLEGSFAEPVLVNYVLMIDSEQQGAIYSAVPEQADNALESYEPAPGKGGVVDPFLDFGAANFHAALAAATSPRPIAPPVPTPFQKPRRRGPR